jgi:hypothetical protein
MEKELMMKLFLVLLSLVAFAEEIPVPADIRMEEPQYTLGEKTYKVSEVIAGESPVLIGGVIADPSEFKASPWVGNCTAAIVGERVLFTAAHCVSNGGSKTFTIGTTRYSSKCTHHPEYRNNSTADFAVCLIDKPVTGDLEFEAVATSTDYQLGQMFLLSGYGCQKWGGGLDGKYRIGRAKITKLPSGTNYDTITQGDVALCSGDSGGPAWFVYPDGSRKLAGVNSRSNTTTTSYLSSHAVKTAQDFYKSWASNNSVRICGIHQDAVKCRGTRPPEPVTFHVENGAVRLEATWKPGAPYTVDEAKKALQDAADYLGEQ